jgi:hypothetical protein
MPIILAIQEEDIKRIAVQSQIVHETLTQKNLHKKGLVEWLNVQALSTSLNTTKKKG